MRRNGSLQGSISCSDEDVASMAMESSEKARKGLLDVGYKKVTF